MASNDGQFADLVAPMGRGDSYRDRANEVIRLLTRMVGIGPKRAGDDECERNAHRPERGLGVDGLHDANGPVAEDDRARTTPLAIFEPRLDRENQRSLVSGHRPPLQLSLRSESQPAPP